MRYDKNIKSKKFPKTFILFDEQYFSKDFEKSKISKSHVFRKSKILSFSKKLTFSKILSFSPKIEKSDFLKFSIFQNLLKNIFHRKNIHFRKFLVLCLFIVSHI